MSLLLLTIVLALAGPLGLYWVFPEEVTRVYRVVKASKQALGAIVGVVLGAAMMLTSLWYLMLAGAVIFGYGVLAFVIDNPTEPLVNWLRRRV